MSRMDNTKFYKAALTQHGHTSKGVHWNSDSSQQVRFDVLLGLLPDITEMTLVDVGCGFGDLYCYMERKPKCYTGIDIMDEMVKEAQKRTSCKIIKADVLQDNLPSADYYICSGAMNILSRFETYLFIRRCYEASTKGFVFNLLEGEDESLLYNYFQPKEIKKMAKELGAKFYMKKGYLPRDFSVFLEKEGGIDG